LCNVLDFLLAPGFRPPSGILRALFVEVSSMTEYEITGINKPNHRMSAHEHITHIGNLEGHWEDHVGVSNVPHQ
jgi:hypothetical protein